MKKRKKKLGVLIVCIVGNLLKSTVGVAAPLSSFIGGGPFEGSYASFANFLSEISPPSGDKKLPLGIKNTGGSLTNIRALSQGEFRMILAQGDIINEAVQGIGSFTGTPQPHLRIVARLYPEYVYVVTHQNSPIQTIYDLKGKHVALGPAGSGTLEESLRILKAYGLEELDIKGHHQDIIQTIKGFKQGRIDAFFFVTSETSTILKNLGQKMPFKLIPISGKERETILQSSPMLSKATLNPKLNALPPVSVETIGVSSHLVISAHEKKEYVYALTKNLWETKIEKKEGIPSLNFALALNELPAPLHPGAERYYKERQSLPR